VQLKLFAPRSGWRAPQLSTLPPWPKHGRVAVDIETCDPFLKKLGPSVRRGGFVVGVSFAFSGRAWYLPMRHDGGGNLDRAQVLAYLKDQAASFRGEIVGANLQYDLDYLAELGIEFQPTFFRDVQLAEPLLDELQFSYSLQAIAKRNGLEGKAEGLLAQAAKHFGLDTKADLWKLPAQHVGPYAEQDALAPLHILEAQERRIRATDAADPRVQAGRAASLWSLWDTESRLLPVLLAMRRRGVRVDLGHADVVEARCVREEEDATAALSLAVGRKLQPSDLSKGRLVGPILEEATGRRFPTTKTGQIELKAPALKALHHPTVDLYLRARRFAKLRTTFVQSLRDHAINGRIHTTFNQLKRESDDGSGDEQGTVSGRLSSTDPNLQQQPMRDADIGPLWRRIYLADDGAEWASLDYSAQEPRWLVHFAAESGCGGAAAVREAYRANPALDLYVVLRDQIGWSGDEGRSKTKTVYLGLAYNMGGAKLCQQLGKPIAWKELRNGRLVAIAGDEGQKVLDDFHAGAPFIRELNERTERQARKAGYVRTVLGRICRFPRLENGAPGYDWTHKATNRIVQGSSADQTKLAMVQAHAAGIQLQLQVHDELDLSVSDRKVATDLAEIMLAAVPCSVPHRVVPEFGRSWGEIE
jgi:DNA polymerase I-like protein with 3'-5' exonuclease and polymerase domains